MWQVHNNSLPYRMRPPGKKSLAIVILVCIAVSLTHCKKPDVTSSFTSYFRGKIDGVSFECNSGINIVSSGLVPAVLEIKGSSAQGDLVIKIIAHGQQVEVGTYNIEQDRDLMSCQVTINNYTYGAYCGFFGDPGPHGKGRVNILDISPDMVKGTFDFTTQSIPKEVSDGAFNIKRHR
jgi:hypothetical protein